MIIEETHNELIKDGESPHHSNITQKLMSMTNEIKIVGRDRIKNAVLLELPEGGTIWSQECDYHKDFPGYLDAPEIKYQPMTFVLGEKLKKQLGIDENIS